MKQSISMTVEHHETTAETTRPKDRWSLIILVRRAGTEPGATIHTKTEEKNWMDSDSQHTPNQNFIGFCIRTDKLILKIQVEMLRPQDSQNERKIKSEKLSITWFQELL